MPVVRPGRLGLAFPDPTLRAGGDPPPFRPVREESAAPAGPSSTRDIRAKPTAPETTEENGATIPRMRCAVRVLAEDKSLHRSAGERLRHSGPAPDDAPGTARRGDTLHVAKRQPFPPPDGLRDPSQREPT